MDKPGLVFLTPDNDSKIRARMAPQAKLAMEQSEADHNKRVAYFKEIEERIKRDAVSQSKRTSD